ncbi:MAG: MazG nucleotide pyrophosphohydrolase domain-containing protein [Dehalococcoidia bacterium]|jgi:NTP pyrophosphatase (non-canonical NTP hydrolase)|nr:MazG nucleotide pyrophosphohydrolase domain-containing protein [Dehalococcoidia bacterium]MDP7261655.1 MazG nucleotide pyrophosphohydrolase domain-containing protein [Dehalococcoidia bacterium]
MADNEQSNQERKYAPNTVGRQAFVESMAKMAGEVWDFHNRFEVGSGQFEGHSATEIVANRTSILDEEFNELAQAISEKEGDDAVADETADILFVAMGHAEAMGAPGIEGVDRVTGKSAAKTNETHAIRPDSGKVLPRKGKPHKWQ